jgi:hypothetical protein
MPNICLMLEANRGQRDVSGVVSGFVSGIVSGVVVVFLSLHL